MLITLGWCVSIRQGRAGQGTAQEDCLMSPRPRPSLAMQPGSQLPLICLVPWDLLELGLNSSVVPASSTLCPQVTEVVMIYDAEKQRPRGKD